MIHLVCLLFGWYLSSGKCLLKDARVKNNESVHCLCVVDASALVLVIFENSGLSKMTHAMFGSSAKFTVLPRHITSPLAGCVI